MERDRRWLGLVNEEQRFGAADSGSVVRNSINEPEFGSAQRFLGRGRAPYRSRSGAEGIKPRSVGRKGLVFADDSPPILPSFRERRSCAVIISLEPAGLESGRINEMALTHDASRGAKRKGREIFLPCSHRESNNRRLLSTLRRYFARGGASRSEAGRITDEDT